MGKVKEANGVDFLSMHYSVSEERKVVADVEIQLLLDAARQEAHDLLTQDRQFLDQLIDTLVAKGALDNSELHEMVNAFREANPIPAAGSEVVEVGATEAKEHPEVHSNGVEQHSNSTEQTAAAPSAGSDAFPSAAATTTTGSS